MGKLILQLVRLVVGVLFIFSGLIKANDPLGLSYKMNEFFEVLHIGFLSGYSLGFSILMIAFEIIAGIAVLLGYRFRIFAFLLLLLIIIFSFLTGFALLSGKIKECGCFGDCIRLTAGQSFWKDISLLVMIIFLFLYRDKIRPLFNSVWNAVLMWMGIVLAFGIQWYTLNHLPVIDCLPYKVGNNIPEKMKIPPGAKPDRFETILIYEKNGLKKEFTLDNYPWQDSTWKFIDRKDKLVEKGNTEPAIKDFSIVSFTGNDSTQFILEQEGYIFLFLVKSVYEAGKGWDEKMANLQQDCFKNGIQIYGITASNAQEAAKFSALHHLQIPFLQMDGTTIKTIGRSNPCLVLLKKGTIMGKWHYHNMPRGASISKDFYNIKLQY